MELGQNLSFSVKSEVYRRGVSPLTCAIKTYEYRSSLRKLIRKLRTFIVLMKMFVKNLKVLVAFLSNQKLEGN